MVEIKKNMVTKMKHAFNMFIFKIDMAGQIELENSSIEITQTQKYKKKE